MADIKNEIPDQEYAYGFNDGDVSVFKTPKGINEEIVTEISKIKNEPEWMLESVSYTHLDVYKRQI